MPPLGVRHGCRKVIDPSCKCLSYEQTLQQQNEVDVFGVGPLRHGGACGQTGLSVPLGYGVQFGLLISCVNAMIVGL